MAELSPNSTVSHYRIVSKIGAGGMGEVYLAQDLKLDRKIALKVLPAEVASKRDRMDRFVREAKSAAALNHPHIAQVHEIGEHEGTHFIVMEFIEGVTLREKIHRERTELAKLLKYLQQAAEGLSKAHAEGIVHRDLKPDNIMITRDGFAKVLDFGLAKLSELGAAATGPEDPTRKVLTNPGIVIGTVGYMSPEQAQGETNEIDQRSDIFSFGCILFEAVTGHQAFKGKDAIDTLNKIIREPVCLLSDFRSDAPNHLQRVVRRCLAKDREDRYQAIKDVALELRELRRELEEPGVDTTVSQARSATTVDPGAEIKTVGGGSGSAAGSTYRSASSVEYVVTGIGQHKLAVGIAGLVLALAAVGLSFYLHGRNAEVAIQSIAVLAFQNKSSDADAEYLSDGLAESLIYRLSRLPKLKVSPTSSVFRYKGKDVDIQKIAAELGVDAVMSGRIVQRGDNLTISIELIDARNNKLIWGDHYDRKLSDLLATQGEIAATITQKLQLKLTGNDERAITKRYTDNNEAYQLYLKGRFHFAKRTRDDIQQSIAEYHQAIKLDPKFALAYFGIAESYAVMPSFSFLSPREAMPEAKAAVAKALELDPDLPEVHTMLALIASVYDWNWTEAETQFKRALELDPNLALTHYRYAWVYLSPLGRHDEAIAEMKRAMELEPLSLQQGANFAAVYMYARQFDLAVEQARKTYDLDPTSAAVQGWLCRTYNAKGMYTESLSIAGKALQPSVSVIAAAAYAYAKSGRRREAEGIISRMKEAGRTQYVVNYWFAITYAALGEKDAAFAELEKSYQQRDWYLPRLKTDPFMDPLRDDPRFANLVERLKLPD